MICQILFKNLLTCTTLSGFLGKGKEMNEGETLGNFGVFICEFIYYMF